MFWGLIMEPNKRYTQTVEKPFHISQAAMDTSTGDNEICQVMVVVDSKNFLVCTLQKNKTIQVPLDLYFKTGNVISFLTNGKCNVHLTGYLDPEFDEEEESDGAEEEEEEEEEAPELVPAKNKNKRKLDSSIESTTKKLKQDTKKVLKQQLDTSQDSDSDEAEEEDEEEAEEEEDGEEDSSEEDSAADLQKLLGGDVDSDDNDESFKPNSTGGGSEEDSGEDSEELRKSEADTSREEAPAKLSKSQKRRLKRQQLKQQQEQPQTNGVVEKKKSKKEQAEPKQKPSKQEGKTAGETKPASPEKRESKTLTGAVQVDDLKVGSGPVAKSGKVVQVYYEGRLKQNNKMFDSCLKGPGFKFRLGSKEVIAGWDVGVSGMKVGGKRKIVCPPAMAYGAKGSPPVIPPNSTLVFEVELKSVK